MVASTAMTGRRDDGKAAGDSDEHLIGGAHGKLGRSTGDLLLSGDIGTTGYDVDVEAFVFVVPLEESVVEAAVFGLWVPISLKSDWDGTCRLSLSLAGGEREQSGDQQNDV
jgi:hypothetical protein